MGGDITRSTYRRKKHFWKVLMQQGRVQLDADWNEQVEIASHHEKTSLNDVVGHSGSPVDSLNRYSDGFKIEASPSISVTLIASAPTAQLSVTGIGFTPGATIAANSITCDGSVTTMHASVTIGPNGTFSIASVTASAPLPNGAHTLAVTDTGGRTASGMFQLGTSTATPGPSSVATSYFIMKGRYYVDGILCENETDVSVTRQPDLPMGPFIFLSPSAGPAGVTPTVVTVMGEGFAANSPITALTFAGTSILPTPAPQTGPSGAFSLTFTVPSTAATGPNIVAISDGTSNAEAVFTVALTVSESRPDPAQVHYPVPTQPGAYVVYLDVWERELTCIEDPQIREVALLGPDTATRKKIVWQVKALSSWESYGHTRLVSAPALTAGLAGPRPPATVASALAAAPPIVARSASRRGKARAKVAAIARGAGATAMASAAPTPEAGAPAYWSISLSPRVASPGTPITLTGTGWVNDQNVDLSFGANLTTPQGTPLPMQIAVASGGNLTPTVFLVPEIPPATYTLTVTGHTSDDSANPTLTVIECDASDRLWTEFITAAKSTGRLRARAQPPALGSDPCIIPPLAGYTGLENLLYRVEIHNSGDVPDPSLPPPANPPPLPTFKWSRNDASVLAGITNIDSVAGVLTVTGTGKDGNLGFTGDPAQPPVWVEVISDLQELWGNPGTLVQLTDVTDTTLTFNTGATNEIGPTVDSINYPQGMNPKVRRWDCSPAPCAWEQTGQPDNYGYFDLENGIQVRFEPGHFNVGDYWIFPARTVTGSIEWPLETEGVDWSKVALNNPAPSDSSVLADFLIQTLGVYWIQGQPFTTNSTNANEIDISGTDNTGKKQTLTLTINSGSTQVAVAGAGVSLAISVVVTPSGQTLLQCPLPAALLPKGIEHHFERLALVETDGLGTVIPISDCRELFPALTDVPRLFYVSGDTQTAPPGGSLASPLMAATWAGGVRFTIVKGDGTLGNFFDSSVPTVSGQGSFIDLTPGSGTPNSSYPDLDGIASCSWQLDQSTSQQLVRADLLDYDGNLTDHPPLYYSASFQTGTGQTPTVQATTGIVELAITGDVLARLLKGVTYVFGLFQHKINNPGVPPAIILGYVGFRNSKGGDYPHLGSVAAMEDSGLYPFSTQANPGLYPFSTQRNPVFSPPIPLFKAVFIDDTNFCIAIDIDSLHLPTNVAGQATADTLVLRWWAMPATDISPKPSVITKAQFLTKILPEYIQDLRT